MYEYDLLGRRTKESVTSKQQTRATTYAYDDSARKVTMTLPDGSKQVTQFTPYGEVEYKGQIGTDGSVRPLLYNTFFPGRQPFVVQRSVCRQQSGDHLRL
ncbi:hypothetical protein [Brevibacillus agri]|uniref:hypothetical protein n=1 Tax=Brevibacillus agri TaxID=51101 RepID=UPI0030F3950C